MKILWVTDYTIKERPAGGAELTDYFMIEYGIKKGHNISICLPGDYKNYNLDDYDLIVLSNNVLFPDNFRNEIFKRDYVVYCHDSLGWKRIFNSDKRLFNSKLNIFLSPLHRKSFGNIENSICIPPYIPPNFSMPEKHTKNMVIYVGNLWDGVKGADNLYNFAKKHSEMKFYFCYKRKLPRYESILKALPNTVMKGYVEYNEVSELLKQAEYFIHLPNSVEAFGRATAEAFLSGCKMIINKNVGSFSYKWSKFYDYFRYKTLNSPNDFWGAIEHIK